jgi:hypothetical protein
MVQHWSAYPAALKPLADNAFCDGVNQLVWHTFTASPAKSGKPGIEYFAGTHINRNVTWFPQAGAFLTYLGRCQFMLRQGQPVTDVCVYIGAKSYQHWGRGVNWSDRATLRLPKSFTYDLITTEVLLDRLEVKEGDLVLPDGLSYRVLVVDPDDESMLPAALQKIAALKKAGATVVFGQRQPQRAPGLAGYPGCDEEVRRLASGLWIKSPALDEALKAKGLLPDFEGPCDYTHRRTGDYEIYFVSGQGASECTFRVSGKQPELWDVVHGTIREAANWRASRDGRTVVSLDLPENGSAFVVFRKPGRPPQSQPRLPAELRERTLPGPWTVTFEPGRGAPESAVFLQLVAWNEHPNEGIKFFSGKATYRKTLDLSPDEAKRAVRLQLGEVKCVAQVRWNGNDLGVVWTAPWSVELTGVVQAGRNELEIDVVNTWVNRLIGDAGQPKEKRITKTNIALQQGQRTIKAYQGFASNDPLTRSGLLGPVRLELLP